MEAGLNTLIHLSGNICNNRNGNYRIQVSNNTKLLASDRSEEELEVLVAGTTASACQYNFSTSVQRRVGYGWWNVAGHVNATWKLCCLGISNTTVCGCMNS
uniref:G-gamma 2 subunit protein n=1 Tax=Pisum sativum TaxID=3888 RepID=Q5EJW8_PEA|nr:G-gamma 2 subunit protein [Pisum sativum]